MQSLLLTIAYDGSHYAGWQIQDNAVTIQEKMMQAGRGFLGEDFTITTASRTDAGVHAIGQRAVLKTNSDLKSERIVAAFNHYLPKDIRVWKAEAVQENFHPRYDARSKIYVYKIWNGKVEMPLLSRDHFFCEPSLYLEKMNEIAALFVGRHDFNAFSAQKKNVKDTVREIYACHVKEVTQDNIDTEAGRAYHITIKGNGFLYNMVRILAGCIVDWSIKALTAQEIEQRVEMAFLTGDRKWAARTLPAKGLTLQKIFYEEISKEEEWRN